MHLQQRYNFPKITIQISVHISFQNLILYMSPDSRILTLILSKVIQFPSFKTTLLFTKHPALRRATMISHVISWVPTQCTWTDTKSHFPRNLSSQSFSYRCGRKSMAENELRHKVMQVGEYAQILLLHCVSERQIKSHSFLVRAQFCKFKIASIILKYAGILILYMNQIPKSGCATQNCPQFITLSFHSCISFS
jgi:hypothetical protein